MTQSCLCKTISDQRDPATWGSPPSFSLTGFQLLSSFFSILPHQCICLRMQKLMVGRSCGCSNGQHLCYSTKRSLPLGFVPVHFCTRHLMLMAIKFIFFFEKKTKKTQREENASEHMVNKTSVVLLHPEETEMLITTPGLPPPEAADILFSCWALILLNSVRKLQLPWSGSDAAQLCSPPPPFASVLRQTERRSFKMKSWQTDGGIIISCSCSCSSSTGGFKCSDRRWNLRDKNKKRMNDCAS